MLIPKSTQICPMKHAFLILLITGLLVGCDSESLAQEDPPFEAGSVQIGDYGPHNLEGDAFELLGARIEGDRLALDVAYGGGCAEHDFAGFTPEVNIAIFPPQIAVFVVHDGNGDMCEAYIREAVELDISTLLDAFGDQFMLTIAPINSPSDDVVLNHNT